MYERHYSCRTAGRRRNARFVGPGECLVLRTLAWDALWAWRLSRYRQDKQTGVECSIFRNEGPVLSSLLIREAVSLARERWPRERLFTFVRPGAVSANPGYCFKRAGWRRCGESAKGLIVLEAA